MKNGQMKIEYKAASPKSMRKNRITAREKRSGRSWGAVYRAMAVMTLVTAKVA
jgi:hypothetical protein